jgi:hypothetical protein
VVGRGGGLIFNRAPVLLRRAFRLPWWGVGYGESSEPAAKDKPPEGGGAVPAAFFASP